MAVRVVAACPPRWPPCCPPERRRGICPLGRPRMERSPRESAHAPPPAAARCAPGDVHSSLASTSSRMPSRSTTSPARGTRPSTRSPARPPWRIRWRSPMKLSSRSPARHVEIARTMYRPGRLPLHPTRARARRGSPHMPPPVLHGARPAYCRIHRHRTCGCVPWHLAHQVADFLGLGGRTRSRASARAPCAWRDALVQREHVAYMNDPIIWSMFRS